jgi:Uma2 family endonuclease
MAESMKLPPETAAMPEKFFEIVNGRRVELPPMGAFESWVATILAEFLSSYARANRLGRVAGEMLFRIDQAADLQRRPDLAFVSYDRWPRNRPVPRTPAWDVVPDLAVEVVSPSNGANEVLTKVLDYFRTGVRLVWVVYPLLEQVHVYESATTIRVLQRGDTLDGGAVLPGFQTSLATWFEDETEPELYP